MKRIIALIVTAVIILLGTINVSAASATVISADKKTAKYEETVAIDVSLAGNTGFTAYGLKITYDKSALELQEFSKGAEYDGFFSGNKANGIVSFASNKSITNDGVLFTVSFKVLTNVEGDYPVTIVLDKIGQSSSDVMQVSVVNGAVSVEHTHRWGNWEVNKEATCVETGVEVRTCSECKTKDERVIAKIDHTFSEWSEVKKASCQENGQEKRVCSCCNAEETRKTAKLSHTYGEWNVTKAPTETQDGLKERTCSCGHVESQVIPAGTIIDSDNNVELDPDNKVENNDDNKEDKKPSNDTNSDTNIGSIIWFILRIILLLLVLFIPLLIFFKRRKEDEKEQ